MPQRRLPFFIPIKNGGYTLLGAVTNLREYIETKCRKKTVTFWRVHVYCLCVRWGCSRYAALLRYMVGRRRDSVLPIGIRQKLKKMNPVWYKNLEIFSRKITKNIEKIAGQKYSRIWRRQDGAGTIFRTTFNEFFVLNFSGGENAITFVWPWNFQEKSEP